MDEWRYFFDHVPHNLDEGTYRIFEPEWKAEILHWFGREDVAIAQKEEFIKALVNFDDGCGDFYRYRAYLLASEAIAHFPECSKGDAIVGQLLKWSYVYFQEKPDWKNYPYPLGSTAREALKSTDKERVIAAFVQLLHTTESRSTLRHAAERLGRLDPGNKTAIAALVLLIQVTQKECRILDATRSLIKIDPGNPTLIPTLVKLTQITPVRWSILRGAIEGLGEVGAGNEEAIAALVRVMQIARDKLIDNTLHYNQYEYIRDRAARKLGNIAKDNKTAIAALLLHLQTPKKGYTSLVYDDRYTYREVVDALRKIAIGNETAIATLSQIIQTNLDVAIRCSAAACLAGIDPGNALAISTLSHILETTDDESIRWSAADSLVRTDPHHQLALNTLFDLVQTSPKNDPPSPAVWSLERIDPNHKLAIDALVHIIQNRPNSWLWEAARSLRLIGVGNEGAIAALIQLIQTTQDESILRNGAENLGRIDPGNKIAIATLVRLIQTAEDADDRKDAAHSLGQIHGGEEMAIATLIEFIQNFEDENEDKYHFLHIADSFRRIAQSDQLAQVVTALKDYLSEQVYKNRSDCYDTCYRIIWHCAQNMTYPDFYKAWHTA